MKKEKTRRGKIQVVKNRKGLYYFRVVASNGNTLCHSESYSSMAKCLQGIEAMKSVVIWGSVEELQ